MKGMESLFSGMLGINPAEMREMFEGKIVEFQAFATNLQQQLGRIEANQVLLYQLMHHAGLIPTPDEMRAQMMRALPAANEVAEHATGNSAASD